MRGSRGHALGARWLVGMVELLDGHGVGRAGTLAKAGTDGGRWLSFEKFGPTSEEEAWRIERDRWVEILVPICFCSSVALP